MGQIIAIDPGYDRCGVAILSEEVGKTEVVFSTCITTDKSQDQYLRLSYIFKQIEELLKKYNPKYLVLESLFFSINKKTAIKVAEARGAILALAGLHNLEVVEVSPSEVKMAMTGNGNAAKEQVEKMVRLTVKIDNGAKLDDEIDAIALGITSVQKIKLENTKKRLAK